MYYRDDPPLPGRFWFLAAFVCLAIMLSWAIVTHGAPMFITSLAGKIFAGFEVMMLVFALIGWAWR